ncbi:hypothetical protein H4J57_19300 [Colwellia sp. BRX8-7]|jgi:hypothetical protein|uniref:hypothetical protein n=1 Tax=Colwellia sp. BRX8-7 TaxID=2759833 RepID=UPI0015F75267|nr:hypothetical protein [Colwellia sp. BRX8-7]MBA6339334.1 hypothetical protein [Colwellia sp. BRX8-7]
MNVKSTTKAVITSSLSSLIIVLGMFVEDLFKSGNLFSVDGLIVMIIFVLDFVSTSFAVVVIAGVPCHLIMSKLQLQQLWQYIVVGLLISFAYVWFITPSNMPQQLQSSSFGVCIATGLIVTFVFWFYAVKPHNKPIKRD